MRVGRTCACRSRPGERPWQRGEAPWRHGSVGTRCRGHRRSGRERRKRTRCRAAERGRVHAWSRSHRSGRAPLCASAPGVAPAASHPEVSWHRAQQRSSARRTVPSGSRSHRRRAAREGSGRRQVQTDPPLRHLRAVHVSWQQKEIHPRPRPRGHPRGRTPPWLQRLPMRGPRLRRLLRSNNAERRRREPRATSG